MNRSYFFRAGFLFAGLGAGARGFDLASVRLGAARGRFKNVGGIDFDAAACEDYERIAAGPATVADLAKMTPEELRAAWGDTAPDVVFLSPPCKGHSGLLSSETAETEKYQEMNALVHQGLFLLLNTWDTPPGLIVLENVPRVVSRGAKWLIQVRQLLSAYGFVFHEEAHDLRLMGDLGAQRRRYLLVARLPSKVPAYVFRPPLKPGKSCGDILAELPLPETEGAGPMHRLPRLSLLNWIRLALIPPGGDWRDLPGMRAARSDEKAAKSTEHDDGDDERHDAHPAQLALDHAPRRGALGVMDTSEPAATVRGRADVRTGPAAVADERLALTHQRAGRFSDQYRVRGFGEPAGTVTGSTDVQEGAPLVADPRIAYDGATARNSSRFKGSPGLYGVGDWSEPLGTVTGSAAVSGSNAVAAVADPRLAVDGDGWGGGRYGVGGWEAPAATVCGESYPSNGSASVADPRVGIDHAPRAGSYEVGAWDEAARTVTGESRVGRSNGPAAVGDPRVALGADNPGRHENKYRVTPFDEPAGTVCGTDQGRVGSGAPVVADPRIARGAALPPSYRPMTLDEALRLLDQGVKQLPGGQVPVILSPKDGTWHRPLTDLELAALQGLPARLDGAPLQLAGKSRAKHRERIGNAVPVGAAKAIAESLLTALLAAATGQWVLGSTGIWVRRDTGRPAEMEVGDAA